MQAKRLHNLDLLRIVSIFMIILLHIIGHGGVLESVSGVNGYFVSLLKSLSIIGVNIFVLISSYIYTNKKQNYRSILKIWIQVIFYSIFIYLTLVMMGFVQISIESLIFSIFPVFTRLYWFASVYIVFFFIVPYLNIIISKISNKEHLVLVIILSFFFSIIPTIFFFNDTFNLIGGYSLLWFIYLFFIASLIHRNFELIRGKYIYFWGYILVSLALSSSSYIISFITNRIFGESFAVNAFYSYNNTLVVVSSVIFFIFFLKIKIKNIFLVSIVNFVSPTSLGVYLIHDNRFLRDLYWQKLNLESFSDSNLIVPLVLITVIVIMIISVIIDKTREFLFIPFYESRLFINYADFLNSKLY